MGAAMIYFLCGVALVILLVMLAFGSVVKMDMDADYKEYHNHLLRKYLEDKEKP